MIDDVRWKTLVRRTRVLEVSFEEIDVCQEELVGLDALHVSERREEESQGER